MNATSLIIRCKCSTAHVDEVTADRDQREWIDAARYMSATVERFPQTDYRGETRWYNRTVHFACWTCGRAFKVQEVRGKFSEKHVCGAKCLASKGPDCECSCRGKNHGRGWA